MTALEAEAHAAGLKYIELDGSVGVLANGAGLTMATMDAIEHFGGRPANFLEIGGEAYTKAETALTILLGNPNIRALLVNFCGAFARTDVMAEGWSGRGRSSIPVSRSSSPSTAPAKTRRSRWSKANWATVPTT